eukprot:TRINITY_DN3012_c0_g1_i4.p1 TRINITY_DN3012_c0_g1~~TRINITY_DN3012_c0_g1_i4.p1  ORF type:complete len:568 (+),score=114.98 TRINITY_DN3012_c0_g1_i4:34-1737(+)
MLPQKRLLDSSDPSEANAGKIGKLGELSAKVVAMEVEKHADHYVAAMKNVPSEHMKLLLEKMSYLALDKFVRSQNYSDSISSAVINSVMKATEDRFRKLFAIDRNSDELRDPHLMLINVFNDENADMFSYTEGDKNEQSIPRLFTYAKQPRNAGVRTVVDSKEEFCRRFDIFTERQLSDINWNNVFVAGGSVLAALDWLPAEISSSNTALRGYFQDDANYFDLWRRRKRMAYRFANADVDIFIYGLSPAEATKKVDELFVAISERNPHKMLVVRTPQAVTFVNQFPFRNIQIILRLYKSPAEVLMGFDIDTCTVGFDGKDVWALPRFHRAVTRRFNLVDLDRRSTSYEYRLYKYSKRGFEVAVPNLDKSRVRRSIVELTDLKNGLTDLKSGLGKLLRLDAIAAVNAGKRKTGHTEIDNPLAVELPMQCDETLLPAAENFVGETNECVSDYLSFFIPWGARWSVHRVKDTFMRNWRSEQRVSEQRGIQHKPRNFTYGEDVQSIVELPAEEQEDEEEEIVADLDEDETDKVLKKLPKRMKWLTVEPGRQFIGSFHPETGDWEKGAYEDS